MLASKTLVSEHGRQSGHSQTSRGLPKKLAACFQQNGFVERMHGVSLLEFPVKKLRDSGRSHSQRNGSSFRPSAARAGIQPVQRQRLAFKALDVPLRGNDGRSDMASAANNPRASGASPFVKGEFSYCSVPHPDSSPGWRPSSRQPTPERPAASSGLDSPTDRSFFASSGWATK